MKIKTEYVYPPIPMRNFDWSAIDEDTYNGPGSPIGFGRTRAIAVEDLLEQIQIDEELQEYWEKQKQTKK